MAFDPSIPNAGQSPGLFPAQSSANFTQLKKIIDADHVFNDNAQTTDGMHKQVSMISRATPVAPITPANAILYTMLDVNSVPQLWYYNGTTNTQLTATPAQGPIRVVGTAILNAGDSTNAYANPGFTWAGTGWACLDGDVGFNFYNLLRMAGNDVHIIDTNAGAHTLPTFSFSSSNLRITNNSSVQLTVLWSLIINRLV